MNKLEKIKNSLSLRLALFRVWFMKNIVVIIEVLVIISIIFMLTGVIDSETPILGATIYKLLSPLLDEINKIIAEKEINGLMSFFSVFISVMMSIGMFTMKAKSIAYEDIKDDKLKLALVQARLYFNEDGKLTKKMEKVTGIDLDGDGTIDGVEEALTKKKRKGFLSGVKSAAEELVIISTVKLDSDNQDENEMNANKALDEAGLSDEAELIEQIEDHIKDDIQEEILEEELPDDYEVPTLFNKIKRILRFFWKKDKETNEYTEEDDLDVITNSVDIDTVVEEDVAAEVKVAVKPAKQDKVEIKTSVVKQPETETKYSNKNEKIVNDFLNTLKRR